MINLENNLNDIHNRIENAAKKAGRKAEDVTLVCVTKTVEAAVLNQALSLGESVFGENRVQELCEKYPNVGECSWHLIGHLQTNKVKYVVGKVSLIHSVDSLHLAREINNVAKKQGIVQDILLEVNISGEESKYGLTTEEIPTIIKDINALPNLCFKGFMTMAPLGAPQEEIRNVFSGAKKLFDSYKDYGAQILSMGMSGDFELAIQEGATHVRVGSAIFKRK